MSPGTNGADGLHQEGADGGGNIPALLELVMEEYSLTQAELGRRLGRDQSTISGWKRGKGRPDPLALHALTCGRCRRHFLRGSEKVDPDSARNGGSP